MREIKDSGIEWIGEIPKHWPLMKMKYLVEFVQDKAQEQDSSKQYIALENIESWTGKYIETENTYGTEGALLCNKDDVIFGKLRPYLAKTMLINKDSVCSSEFAVMKGNGLIPRFLNYLARSDHFISVVNAGAYGTKMPRANIDQIGNLYFPVPPSFEQEMLSSFLDSKCAEIDSISEDIRKEIETLQEYRKSVITEAVTKGLDPNVEMKDSGTCSIGLIPASWTACKALYCLSMPITDGPHTTPELYDDGIPFVSAEAVSCGNGSIDFNHIRGYISKEFYEECCQKYVPQIDDVYMIKSGATTGRVSIVDTNQIFTIWSPLAVFRVNKSKMLARYLFYMLQSKSVLEQVELSWSFGTQQNIGMRVLERLIVTRPKIDEQKQIVAYLNDKCSEIDSIIANKQKQLDILAEYRKSLIYEYVTGKKEVPTC